MAENQRPKTTNMSKIKGLIAAPFTPFHEDCSLNLKQVADQADLLRREGVVGAFICGTTGEGASLTIEERMEMAGEWARASKDDLALIVHVGHNSVETSRELAAHAQFVGAKGIAALAPSFFKPQTIDNLIETCRHIADAAPALPFYYYHIPAMTGVNLSMPAFMQAAAERIPTFAGIKYSNSNLMAFNQCARYDAGRYTMFFGSDEMLLGAMAMGAEAAVGSTYNYAAPNYVKMIKAFTQGDLERARIYAGRAVALVATLMQFDVLPAGKAIMALRGIDCGPVRLPLRTLTDDQKKALYKKLRVLDLFEFTDLVAP